MEATGSRNADQSQEPTNRRREVQEPTDEQRKCFRIFVKGPKKTSTVQFHCTPERFNSTRILELKRRFSDLTDSPGVDYIRLLLNSPCATHLEDEKTFSFYGLKNDSSVHVVLRLCGGGQSRASLERLCDFQIEEDCLSPPPP